VFELSVRQDKKSVQDYKLYITVKGITARKTPRCILERIQLNILFENIQNNDTERPVDILADVPVSNKRVNAIPENDESLLLFSSPSSVGLIDISLHGAFPYQDQSLDLLRMAIEKYTVEGHSVKLDELQGNSQEFYNVVVRKVRLDSVQYLLYLPIPVEIGHTIKVVFPSVETTLRLQSYVKSDFAIMHKINESIVTLSVPDLRQLLTWLRGRADLMLPSTDIEKSAYVESLVRRRRLYWLERRILAVLERQKVSNEVTLSNAEYLFCQYSTYETELIKQDTESSNLLIDEIEIQLRYAIELDITCGSNGSRAWNTFAKHFFDDVVRCVAQCMGKSRGDDLDWSPLLDLINSTICPNVIAENSISISPGGSGDHMEIDGTATSTDNFFCEAATESQQSQISHNFIWQVVNSVFDVLRIDIFKTENVCTLRTCLLSIHSILFDADAIVTDPILIKYEAALSYASPMPRSDIDFVPNTNMLFLGLIWPVLRNCGWRIVINKESNEVSYIPKAMSQKRRGAMRKLRDRLKVRTKRSLKVAGFHLIPKAAKRLLVAITSKTLEVEDADVVFDKRYTVEAILNKFLASLYERFTALKDFAKFRVNEISRNIVMAIGECFDSCASMLSPISTLSPNWNVAGESVSRPIAAYRCEYLIPFLFNFVSRAAFQASSDVEVIVVGDAVHGLALDLLTFISEHYQEFFDRKFQPPLEEYVANDTSALWIETHIHSLLLENEQKKLLASDAVEAKTTTEVNLSAEPEIFQILLDEEKDQVTDFIRITLENSKLFFSKGDENRRKTTRQLGAPGLVCQHCSGKYGEGKYFFSSMESLSTCYPVLEKHYYKCPDTPPAIKIEVAKARALHIQQRRLKPTGTQQAVFVKLWNRMVKCKPEIALLQNGSTIMFESEDDIDYNSENSNDDDELVFTDHQTVIEYIRTIDSKSNYKLSKNQQEEIEDAFDTYYACIEYAGRIYGTTSMPQHFSTRWLLHKLTSLGQVSPPCDSKINNEAMRVG
jgi:hypothetical protein